VYHFFKFNAKLYVFEESTAYVAPQGPDNIIEKAVKLLQIEYIDSLKLDIENLHQQNERKSREILKMEEKDKTSLAIIENTDRKTKNYRKPGRKYQRLRGNHCKQQYSNRII